MKAPTVVMIDVPCPLCHSSDTPGPYKCKRCGLDVCKECHTLSGFGLDRGARNVYCKPCIAEREAEAVVDGLGKEPPGGPYTESLTRQLLRKKEQDIKRVFGGTYK